jgi:hypothetical protein
VAQDPADGGPGLCLLDVANQGRLADAGLAEDDRAGSGCQQPVDAGSFGNPADERPAAVHGP